MTTLSVSSIHSTQQVTPIFASRNLSARGLEQYQNMTYSRDVEKEDNHALVNSEKLFAEQLTKKIDIVNSADIHEFVQAINIYDFQKSPILLHPDLPYLAMEALRRGLLDPEHGQKQTATALNFWGAFQYHKGPNDLQTIELFIGNAPNPQAEELMKQSFTNRFLEGDKFQTFMENVRKLPASEQRFLLVPDIQVRPSSDKLSASTISQSIKQGGINVFNRVNLHGKEMRIVPSIGMEQAFLDAQYDQPVTIKPRIYLSTDMQLRECGLTNSRDMMMSFPDGMGDNRCPKTADTLDAPWYDFSYHDFYHAIVASAIGEQFRSTGIVASDVTFEYAKKSSSENQEIQRLGTRFLDMEYRQFLHFIKDLKISPIQNFWKAMIEIIRYYLSEKNQLRALYNIYYLVVRQRKNVAAESSLAELLLLRGTIKPEVIGEAQIEAVIYAAELGHLEVLQDLLKDNVALFKDVQGKAVAAAAENSHETVVKWLNSYDPN